MQNGNRMGRGARVIMGNITINIWMILAVILSAGMVAILVFFIYREINKCHNRIDKQGNIFEKIDGRIDNIKNEITNIKIDQATIKAVQAIGVEGSKAQPSAVPIHIYGQQSPQQSLQPTVQPAPQPLENPYEPHLQQVYQRVQPQTQQQEPRRVQQTPQVSGRGQEPIYHQKRMPAVSLTEFQLPEECDFEDEVYSPSRPEPVAQPIQQTRPELVPQQRPQPRPEITPQQIPDQGLQPRPASIPQKEKIAPSKFNSLNDGISRTGKQYSEEELAHRILD